VRRFTLRKDIQRIQALSGNVLLDFPGTQKDPDIPYIVTLNLAKLKKRKTKKAATRTGAS